MMCSLFFLYNKSRDFLFICSLLLSGFSVVVATESTATTNVIDINYDGKVFRAIEVNPKHVALHWQNAKGERYTFSRVKDELDSQGKKVVALMNAGIYSKSYEPAGLHIENGQVRKKLNRNKGSGNFHLQPNGIFLVTSAGMPKVMTTATYHKYFSGRGKTLKVATQSGPMILIKGKINRKFLPKSKSLYTRNGVCTTKKNKLYFVATQTFPRVPSNFYQFARAMKKIGCYNALYLDGNISKLYISGDDSTFHFAPFVGILSVSGKK